MCSEGFSQKVQGYGPTPPSPRRRWSVLRTICGERHEEIVSVSPLIPITLAAPPPGPLLAEMRVDSLVLHSFAAILSLLLVLFTF